MADLTVVRGPDWKWGDQDGGEGGSGTVLKLIRNPTKLGTKQHAGKTAIVKWSNGSSNIYRVGAENGFDLRILDNSSTDMKHEGVKCDSCDEWKFKGFRWKCIQCDDYDLCSQCYMNDKHNLSHAFYRIDSPGSDRVTVPKRKGSTKVKVKKRAKLDGDSLIELLVNIAIEVEEKFYYRDHLPVLVLPAFIVDDKVRIHSDMEQVKLKQKGHGGWNEKMENALGKIGKVVKIDSDGDLRVAVDDHVWAYNPACVTRIDDSELITSEDIGTALSNALSEILSENGTSALGGLIRSLSESISSVEIVKKDRSSSSDSPPSSLPSISSSESSASVSESERWIEKLLDEKGDVNIPNEDGDLPLHIAVESNNVEMVEALLKIKADVNLINAKGQSALHLAIEKGNLSIVKLLLKQHCDVCIPDSYGNTALHCAIGKHNTEIVGLLVDHSTTDVKLKNNRGYNALHHAAWMGNNFAVEKIIEKAPYIVDEKNDDDNTALHLSVRSGHLKVTKTLLEKSNCGIDVRNQMQETPLLVAAKMSRFSEVELLVFMNADIHAKDEAGNTALHLALLNQRIEDGIILTDAPVISRIFSEMGKLSGVEKNCGLAIACFLAQKGSNLEEKNSLGKTPFDLVPSAAVQELLLKFSCKKRISPQLSNAEPTPRVDELGSECMVCSDKVELIVLQPCGHRVVCKHCSLRMKKCIHCKQEITEKLQPNSTNVTRGSGGNETYTKKKQHDILAALGVKRH